MRLNEEAKQIRIEVARLRPGRGRKYTRALRRRILVWVENAKQSGMNESDCAEALGIPMHRFEGWRESERREANAPPREDDSPPVALVPVESPSLIPAGVGLVFVGPRGCRVEGLTLEQAFALLREFE